MSGYSSYSMSNNAVLAYERGLCPASKIKGVPTALISEWCRYEEWHHSSSRYNKVEFFQPEKVRAIFGLELHEDYPANPDAVAALAAYKLSRKAAETTVHTGCVVEWIEWTGSIKRPKPNDLQAAGCVVAVKADTATVTFADGSKMTKRLSTNGFKFTPEEPA